MVNRKVLVVDDEYKIRTLLELYLRANEYDVIMADCGSTALHAVEKHNPDIVVLDIMLPGMNGLEVCKKIRMHWQIPIIYLSGLPDSKTIISGLNFGGDDYVTKPFDPHVLLARINAILRRKGNVNDEETNRLEFTIESLTGQEIRILQWIEKGFTNREIADKLKLKEGTIKVYNHTIFQKLGVKNRTQAIVKAKEARMI